MQPDGHSCFLQSLWFYVFTSFCLFIVLWWRCFYIVFFISSSKSYHDDGRKPPLKAFCWCNKIILWTFCPTKRLCIHQLQDWRLNIDSSIYFFPTPACQPAAVMKHAATETGYFWASVACEGFGLHITLYSSEWKTLGLCWEKPPFHPPTPYPLPSNPSCQGKVKQTVLISF